MEYLLATSGLDGVKARQSSVDIGAAAQIWDDINEMRQPVLTGSIANRTLCVACPMPSLLAMGLLPSRARSLLSASHHRSDYAVLLARDDPNREFAGRKGAIVAWLFWNVTRLPSVLLTLALETRGFLAPEEYLPDAMVQRGQVDVDDLPTVARAQQRIIDLASGKEPALHPRFLGVTDFEAATASMAWRSPEGVAITQGLDLSEFLMLAALAHSGNPMGLVLYGMDVLKIGRHASDPSFQQPSSVRSDDISIEVGPNMGADDQASRCDLGYELDTLISGLAETIMRSTAAHADAAMDIPSAAFGALADEPGTTHGRAAYGSASPQELEERVLGLERRVRDLEDLLRFADAGGRPGRPPAKQGRESSELAHKVHGHRSTSPLASQAPPSPRTMPERPWLAGSAKHEALVHVRNAAGHKGDREAFVGERLDRHNRVDGFLELVLKPRMLLVLLVVWLVLFFASVR